MPQTETLLHKFQQDYADAGFTVFPLNGKIPKAGVRWRNVQFNPFPRIPGNFGVVLGPDDLVVDVDPRNGGNDSLIAFEAVVGPLPQTMTIKTGSGGLHVYLKKPKDFKTRQGLRDFRGIDFLSVGHYVVGCGSTHPDSGLPYLPLPNTRFEMAATPQNILDKIKRVEVEHSEGNGGIEVYVNDEQTQKRYISYLKIAPIAIEGQSGDATTFSVAAVGHDFGLDPDTTYDLISRFYNDRCLPPWDHATLKTKVYNAYKYSAGGLGTRSIEPAGFTSIETIDKEDKRYSRDQYGNLKKNLNNCVKLMTIGPLKEMLGFNEFTKDITFNHPAPWHLEKKKPKWVWDDDEALDCQYWLSHSFSFEPTKFMLHDAAVVAARQYPYHPVKRYLSDLKWDGHKRLHEWMVKHLSCEDNDYVRAVGLKFMVAAVKRIFEPGCKYDYIPVLEGEQGTGKSTVFNILASPWYSDHHLDLGNKDYVDAMRGQWIIELPEMETHYKSETQAMKAFLSRATDRIRLPYARMTADFPRQCVFAGTINPEDLDIGYLKDTTGNRRYWPVKTGTIDLNALKLVRDQLWAEALLFYKQGIPIYLDDAAIITYAMNEQKMRLGRDAWHGQISEWLIKNDAVKTELVVAGERIYTDCLGGKITMYGTREQRRIAGIMRMLGWDQGVFYNPTNKVPTRGYRRPMIQ